MDGKIIRKGDKCILVRGDGTCVPATVADDGHLSDPPGVRPPLQKVGDALRGVPTGLGVEKVYVNVVTPAGKTELVCEDDLEPVQG